MRCTRRTSLIGLLALGASTIAGGCDSGWVDVPGGGGAVKSAAGVRAERRLYDGAPPVIPHASFGAACTACHDSHGTAVAGVGYAPASPHEDTPEAGATIRCRQCHVFVAGDDLFVANEFVGLRQDMRAGGRMNPMAPTTIPHRVMMRENCIACHSGPAAREEIRTAHPERTRCRQCHVEVSVRGEFESQLGAGLVERDSARVNQE